MPGTFRRPRELGFEVESSGVAGAVGHPSDRQRPGARRLICGADRPRSPGLLVGEDTRWRGQPCAQGGLAMREARSTLAHARSSTRSLRGARGYITWGTVDAPGARANWPATLRRAASYRRTQKCRVNAAWALPGHRVMDLLDGATSSFPSHVSRQPQPMTRALEIGRRPLSTRDTAPRRRPD